MADALVSTPVAGGALLAAVALTAVAGSKIRKDNREDLIPLMGVMGAFIFAAQMVNFSIPATGSSGHIIGGVLLSAMLGPWAAFLTLVSVLLIQCLIFADGGFLALGCNILNMAGFSCLVAYPLIFRPLLRFPASSLKIFVVSVLACTIGLELGAVAVTFETELSGVTALSTSRFLLLMTGIHLLIGIGEGLATGAVLYFVQKTRPSLLIADNLPSNNVDSIGINPSSRTDISVRKQWPIKRFLLVFAIAALIIGGVIALYASSNPDGLEWSIQNIVGSTELETSVSPLASKAAAIQDQTAIMPDYEHTLSGIAGALITLLLAWGIGSLFLLRRKSQLLKKE